MRKPHTTENHRQTETNDIIQIHQIASPLLVRQVNEPATHSHRQLDKRILRRLAPLRMQLDCQEYIIIRSLSQFLYSRQPNRVRKSAQLLAEELPDESIQYEYLNRYLRIDFDSLGYTELTHTYVHMHMGIFEHSTRLPVSHTISPLEFLSLIFTHYYAEPISFPNVMGVNYSHIVRLSANENDHFKFSFGNKVEPFQK